MEVDHDCTSIDVSSSKDISDVVLQLADGATQRFEDLPERRTGTFAGTGDGSAEHVLGMVVDRAPEDGLRAAGATDVRSAGLLPDTGADADSALAVALAAPALGSGVLRRTRRTRPDSA